MLYDDTSMSDAKNTSSTSYARLINQRTLQDDVFYENVRVRFLKQSASYLGVDLDDCTTPLMRSTAVNSSAAGSSR